MARSIRWYDCSQKQYCRADDEPAHVTRLALACNRKTDPRSEPQHEIVAEREP